MVEVLWDFSGKLSSLKFIHCLRSISLQSTSLGLSLMLREHICFCNKLYDCKAYLLTSLSADIWFAEGVAGVRNTKPEQKIISCVCFAITSTDQINKKNKY